MLEHVLQMGPMLVLAGLVAGWGAEGVSRADGHGFIRDLAVGLVGSVVGGATLWVVVSSEAGMLVMFLIGCGGATLAILAQRRGRAPRPRRGGRPGGAPRRSSAPCRRR